MKTSDLTNEQQDALNAWEKAKGRQWKHLLLEAWLTGQYR